MEQLLAYCNDVVYRCHAPVAGEPTISMTTLAQALRFLRHEGVMLESARSAEICNLADAMLGENRTGSWWGHPRARAFFRLTRRIRSHPDVLVCHLVGGKITYVHRRLWPALLRLAPTLGPARVASIEEIHTESGAHTVRRTPLGRWVPPAIRLRAERLTLTDARAQLGSVSPRLLKSPRGARSTKSARRRDKRAPE